MAREVKVTLELLESAAIAYDEQITILEDAYQRASNAIEQLRDEDWKSTGSDLFFQTYDDEWKRNLSDHISYLRHLRDCLKLAHKGFNEEYRKTNLF